MNSENIADNNEITGSINFPSEWFVFAAFESGAPILSGDDLKEIPESLTVGGKTKGGDKVTATRNQYDLKLYFDEPPYDETQAAYVFVPLESEKDQEVTLGMGADWTMKAWLNGEEILDTLMDGNKVSPPAINNFKVNVKIKKGRNVLAAVIMNGRASALIALGGPEELRKGDFTSILPPPEKLTAQNIFEKYPPDPDAPFRWIVPESFNLDLLDLGFPELEQAEHFEIMHALKSKAPLDEGGTGKYEGVEYGSWNHNNRIAVFKDRLIGIWDNHSMDENGPGGRVLAKVGKVINSETGEVDWGGSETIVEPAPAPVPVRRRKIHCDTDVIRGAQAKGGFCEIEGRLFFCGSLGGIHGITTAPHKSVSYWDDIEDVVEDEDFFFGPVPEASVNKSFKHWHFGVKFYQEWDVVDDRLQPVSPIYKKNELPEKLKLTPTISLPLEPLVEPYNSAPLLADAPEDFQHLVDEGKRNSFRRIPKYKPFTNHLTEDGTNGLIHNTEFMRPDGVWVVVRENQKPTVQPVYYAATKKSEEDFYPPAKRTNLYGAVNPAAGELPDGKVFLVGNSPNRRTMFLTVSKDGKVFDKTWFLMHQQLKDYTPGIMKSQGGPGSGPQYFVTAVIGESLWIIYSICKEHIGATRVPLAALE